MCEVWPFLIGRTRTHDHRLVVVPAFMAATTLAGVLRNGADGRPVPPGTARIRELRPVAQPPITIVYRTFVPSAEDYDLPGTATLTDEHGRPILLTEGFVLQGPAISARKCDLTSETLDRVRSELAPAYRAFWAEGADYQRQTSVSFRLISADPAATSVVLEEDPPWVQARSPGKAPVEVSPHRATHRQMLGTVIRVVIAAVIAAIALAILGWVVWTVLLAS